MESDNMNKTVGNNIRRIREDKKMSREDVYTKVNISKSAYLRIENGETSSWASNLTQISEILEVEPQELIKGEQSQIQVNSNCSGYASSFPSGNNIIVNIQSEKLIVVLEKRIEQLEKEVERLSKKK